METVSCPVCGGKCSLLDVVDFNKSCEEPRGEFLGLSGIPVYYVLCVDCGFCFAPELMTWTLEKFEERIYNEEYVLVDTDYVEIRPRANAANLISMFGDGAHAIKHLDYGGGSGLLAKLLQASGWQSTSYDPFVDRNTDVQRLGKYDLITAFEVFEHVPDARELMSDLRSLLSPNGLIVFSTLLSDGSIHPNERISWWYASPRNGHISLFSKKSLGTLAKNYGFDVDNISQGLHVFFTDMPAWAGHLVSRINPSTTPPIRQFTDSSMLNIGNGVGTEPSNPARVTENNVFECNFLEGAFLGVSGPSKQQYHVVFTDQRTNRAVYAVTIENNAWAKASNKYLVDWKVEVFKISNNELVFREVFEPSSKRIYIIFSSSAIGDTLAWFPYVDQFQNVHKSHVIVSTFHNKLFEGNYPNIEFVEPGTMVYDLYAVFELGFFYDGVSIDYKKNPTDFTKLPLQQTATEILGLTYAEIKPKVKIPDKLAAVEGKYVVIAPHASAHAKYWNSVQGWQAVVDYLNNAGYKVVMLGIEVHGDEWHDSKLGGKLQNIVDKTGPIPLEERMIDIRHADLFVGVGSGLSWLSWALDTPTVMISGFSYPYTEFAHQGRVFTQNPEVCSGCFNRHRFNQHDWDWCPDHKDTLRQFECTKTISPIDVIKSINRVLRIDSQPPE